MKGSVFETAVGVFSVVYNLTHLGMFSSFLPAKEKNGLADQDRASQENAKQKQH